MKKRRRSSRSRTARQRHRIQRRPRTLASPRFDAGVTKFRRLKTAPPPIRHNTTTIRTSQASRVVRRAVFSGSRVLVQPTLYRAPAVTRPAGTKSRTAGRSLRLSIHPTGCIRRKNRKKEILRSVAAQAGRSGMLSLWRRRRRRATSQVVFDC